MSEKKKRTMNIIFKAEIKINVILGISLTYKPVLSSLIETVECWLGYNTLT